VGADDTRLPNLRAPSASQSELCDGAVQVVAFLLRVVVDVNRPGKNSIRPIVTEFGRRGDTLAG
jgi:hypothetical protein